MKILVTISCVPDTTSKINFTPDNKAFDKTGIQFVINPYDEFCLSKAVNLKEQGATVTVLTLGDTSTQTVIQKALAIGADEAIRVDFNPQDSFSTAQEIVEIIKEGGYDLILMGKESIDYNGGAVPGLVAGLLNLPFVNGCIGLEINGSNANATRDIDGGKEFVKISLPAIIGGQKGLVDESALIIPNMRGIMQAKTKPYHVVSPKINTPKTKVVSFDKPPARSSVKLIDKSNLGELVRLLNEEAKVI